MEKEDMILEELRRINKRLDAMDGKVNKLQEDLDELKEAQEETRSGVNALIEWAEDVSNAIRFPLPKLK